MSFALRVNEKSSNGLLKERFYYSNSISGIMKFVREKKPGLLCKPEIIDLEDDEEIDIYEEGELFDDE